MAELNEAAFEAKYNDASTGRFKTGQNRGIGSDDLRELITDIKDSIAFGTGGIPAGWSFTANAGAHPTDLTKRYYTTDDTVYPQGTEFWTNGSGGWFTK